VSKIYAIFSFFCCVGLRSADTYGDGYSPLKKGLRLHAGAEILRFDRIAIALITALACCLIIATSGCGAGVSKSLGGGLLVSPGTLNFGSVPVGHEADSNVNVSNNSPSSIVISQVNISGQTFSVLGGSNMPISVPAGGSSTLKIGFTPVSAVSYSGQLTLMDSSAQSVAQVPMQGQGSSQAVPELTISAATLSFGSVTVNATTTQSLTLTSTGASPVTVNSVAITGAGFTIVGGSLPVTLNPTQSTTLQVQFDPTSPGAASGQLAISSNSASGNAAVVNLSGTGTTATSPQTSPLLTISAASLSFGNVTVNTATTQSLTLTSTGTSPVTVNSAVVAGAGFTIVGGSLPVTLSPTQSMTLQVQFLPTVAGAGSGQITISSNSSTGSTTVVALNGTSTTAPSPQLAVSAASLSFGSVTVNSATTQAVTLTSAGTSAVTVNSAAIAGGGFAIVGGSFPVTLNPSQSVTLQIKFLPTTASAFAGQLTISSNSSTNSTALVALSGTGAAAANPQLTVSTASLSFGSVTVNSATTQAVTLTSTGTSAVTVNSAAIAGAGFAIVGGSFAGTLNPSQSVTLQIQFLPTTAGAVAGQLTISSDSSTNSTALVSLSGTGTAAANPQLTVSTASLSFGSVTVNSATTRAATLTSTGTSAVTINSASIAGAGFTIVAGSFPVTLNPSQSLTLQIQFLPTTGGAVAGQLTIGSNSSTSSTAIVALSGTGVAANPQLTVSTASLGFGSVTVNSATIQTVTLTSTGTSAVTINAATITGAGFTTVGGSFPLTLNPAQTATLQIQFDPTTAGAATGQLTISSNSASGGTTLVALSGTGTSTAHYVDLSWSAPASSTDPVAGYNIYRSISGGTMQMINASPVTQNVYVDNAVVSGSTYNYYAKSVDASGVESTASNQIAVTIP
jgi:hypothetical protein